MILGIDPGPEESAVVWLNADGPRAETMPNRGVVELLRSMVVPTAIEDFVPYGQRLGYESIATVKAIGVFEFAAEGRARLIPRPEIKRHLCGTHKATDADVRDALMQRFGPGRKKAVGTKTQPGPLYGFKGHHWAALAVAVTAQDTQQEGPQQ